MVGGGDLVRDPVLPTPRARETTRDARMGQVGMTHTAENDAPRLHVVSVVYDFERRALHWCLVCHYAGFTAPPLPCPGRPIPPGKGDT